MKKNNEFNIMAYVISFIMVFICCSCYQDVVDIDLSRVDKQIVIQGNISDRPGPYTVKLSETSNIFQPTSIPQVSGAIVIISDNTGITDTLRETEAGIYQTRLIYGVPGNTYVLKVIYNGKEYTSTSKMPDAIEIDSVVFTPEYSFSSNFSMSCFFNDHAGVEDYCRINLYKNGEFLDYEKILYQDNYTDGELVEIDEIDTNFSLNDVVEIELFTITKDIYDFYDILYSFEDDGNPGGSDIIELTSSNPKSNISNNALGYFSTHNKRYYRYVITSANN